ncbi:unnamed protein product, partial [Mesorhabditis belari]|uniref:F-box domain-containing protein n=1 Tax=Mesorhabditis belari TaxID=2138241 RepID=A0AAF3J621_9BILA
MMDILPNEIKSQILELLEMEEYLKVNLLNSQWNDLFLINKKRLRRKSADEIRFYDLGDGQIQVQIVLEGTPHWTKQIISKTVAPDNVFSCVWPYSPKEMHINSFSNALKEIFEAFPDYWFCGIEKLGIFEEKSNVNAMDLMRRCPDLHSISIDPCFSDIHVTAILNTMKRINELKLPSTNQHIVADDSSLQKIIEKSKNDEIGLRTFWVDSIPTNFSLEMVEQFLLESHFADRCSILLQKIHGSDFEFVNFLRRHFELISQIGAAFTFRNAQNSEITVIIGSFER